METDEPLASPAAPSVVSVMVVHQPGEWFDAVLAGLAIMRPALGRDLPATAGRFSTLALWCFVAVALSGLQGAYLRIGTWDNLASRYGVLVLVKALALVLQ